MSPLRALDIPLLSLAVPPAIHYLWKLDHLPAASSPPVLLNLLVIQHGRSQMQQLNENQRSHHVLS